MDRREFARSLAVGVVAVPTALVGNGSTAGGSQEPQTPSAADQLLAMLQAQFPSRLTDEQWKQVRTKLEDQLRAADELRKFKLQNADEPATVFAAYRKS